jgi:gamma-D-glutamyl-L-lysine dipeptidyl-peptidase
LNVQEDGSALLLGDQSATFIVRDEKYMKMYRNFVLFVLLMGTTGFSQMPLERNVISRINEIQKKYAPDKRMAIFDVHVEHVAQSFVLKGEVGDPEAKKEVLAVIPQNSAHMVFDSILVLPDHSCKEKPFGIVSVSVASLRQKPRDTSGLVSQTLLGSSIKVLKIQGAWAFIQTPDDNYLGWMKRDQFVQSDLREVSHWMADSIVIVTETITKIYSEPAIISNIVLDATIGALVKYEELNDQWYAVRTPDGKRGYMQKNFCCDYSSWKSCRIPTTMNIEKTAKTFLGIPYLWGGTSAKAFDCSGFTKTVFRMNGISLLRDADQQASEGKVVGLDKEFTDVRTGDLLFFRKDTVQNSNARITHVGIYVGNKEFIHCAGCVKLNSFDPASPRFSRNLLQRLVKAKRYVQE